MATRSFVVFQDPSSPVKTAKPRPLGRTASAAAILTSSRLSENSSGAAGNIPASSSSASEKENMNPITGLGVRSALGKKRKAATENTVLATKLLALGASSGCDATTAGNTATAGAKALKSKPLNPRVDLKRKALSDAGSDKTKVMREGSKSARSGGGSSTVSAPSVQRTTRSASKLLLETIEEEASDATEESEDERKIQKRESTKQVLIDSKCRDLTVIPLANVTDAYTQSSDHAVDTGAKDEEEPTSVASHEDLFFSSHIRDYFAPQVARKVPNRRPLSTSSSFSLFDACGPKSSLPSLTSTSTAASTSEPVTPTKPKGLSRSMSLPAVSPSHSGTFRDDDDAKSNVLNSVLSTPQRQELYASFTFSSPIPIRY